MKTKDKLLALLEENRGTYLSGEDIAEKLDVSRTAVWKAVEALRDGGYAISAAPNRGYMLSADTDVLSAQGVKRYLDPSISDLDIIIYPEVTSTNNVAKDLARSGAPEGTVVIALTQTAGKGRLGRSFSSPGETGLYMSLLLRPAGVAPDKAVRVTTIAAVAACEAIEELSARQAKIKWVNDVFVGGKKVSGILTEASMDLESSSVEYMVMGIGFNVYEPEGGFPQEIRDVAGAILPERKSDGKNILAAGMLNHFMRYYADGALGDLPEGAGYAAEYRTRSLVTGRQIDVLLPSGAKRATAVTVDDECRLIVKYEDGTTDRLSSGEISVRLK